MSTSSHSRVYGIVALAIGILLVLGGLMFLLVTQMIPDAPPMLPVPALIQIGLGITGAIAGLLMWRGNAAAKFILAFVGVGVVANIAFVLVIFASLIR